MRGRDSFPLAATAAGDAIRSGSLLLAALLLAAAGPLAATTGEATPSREAGRPNIVIFLADDLGWSDLGSYGSEIATPALDRLAADGVRFLRYYSTPRCSPSRAALLTGRQPHTVGVGYLNLDWQAPAYRGEIDANVPLLPELLRDAGYRTYMVGKWHLSLNPSDEAPGPRPSWPTHRGFDEFYGTIRGSGSYFDPPSLHEGDRPLGREDSPGGSTPAVADPAYYYTDALASRAKDYLELHAEGHPEAPFFLYVSFTAPHWPLQVPADEMEAYRGRFDAGWDRLREERLERMKSIGLVPATTELAPRDGDVAAWPPQDAAWQAQRMEAYAAMVTRMDRAVGEILAAVDRVGSLDRTIVLFASDNGASGEEFRGLYRLAPLFVPVPRQTRTGKEVHFGDDSSAEPGSEASFISYGRGWAQLSNTPFRLYKRYTHEGGIAAPLILRWPAVTAARAGFLFEPPSHVIDLTPTLLGLAGITPSAETTFDGVDLTPYLESDSMPSRSLFWEHEGNRAVMRGRWKLVSRWPLGFELYDLSRDRSERTNLAAENAERVEELGAAWRQWAAEVGVETWPLVVPQVGSVLRLAPAGFILLLALLRLLRRRRPEVPPPQETASEPPPARPPSAPSEPFAPFAPPEPTRTLPQEKPPPIVPR